MEEYRFERVSEKNLDALISLFKAAFNYKAELSFLKQKFNTRPFGAEYIGYLAIHNQTQVPAAYYGVFPSLLQYKEEKILAAQSGDTMTHPDHRGKGLFITLAKMSYALAKEQGIHFIYGFPNKNSYPGFVNKLNWKHYSNINNYRIETGALPLDKLAKKLSFAEPLFNTLYNGNIKKINSDSVFTNSLSQQMPSHGNVMHDELFRSYKSYYESNIVTLAGKKCWIKADGRLWVGDIEFCDESSFNAVIDELTRFAKKNLCATVHFSVNEGSVYDERLKKKLPLHSQDPIGALDLSGKIDPSLFAYQAVDFDTY